MSFIIEGLDRLGKNLLIDGIKNQLGYFSVIHRGKPELLDFYVKNVSKINPLLLYQKACFSQDMALLKSMELSDIKIIFNRSWIGEAVYSKRYRNYDGNYVFELEKIAGLGLIKKTKLILLTEDFSVSKHFVDDGKSFDISKRQEEQKDFIEAFNRSIIKHKKIVCVTDKKTGEFRPALDILEEALTD